MQQPNPKRLDVCDLQDLPFDALMYQGGYLTIKSVLENGKLVLGIPNREVREAICGGFLDEMLKSDADEFAAAAYDVRRALESSEYDVSNVGRILTSVFAMVPHEWKIKSEAEAKRYFLLFMRMVGATINAEVESSVGRADAILETRKTLFIFEFKYARSPRQALRQIAVRGYARPYAAGGRKIVCIGINYNPKAREVQLAVDAGGPVKSKHGPVNTQGGPVNVQGGPVKLVEAIMAHPGLRKVELSAITGITERTIKRYLTRLTDAVEFRGAPKTGGYYMIDETAD